jgi:elongation factor G
VISVAIEPKTKADQEKMGMALAKLADEDPTFKVRTDEESGQTIISGMGELHLEILVDRMKREHKVEANVGEPKVAFRETIRKEAEAEGKYIRQTGGSGNYGHARFVWSRTSRARASSSSTRSRAASFPRNTSSRPSRGFARRCTAASWPATRVVDLKATLYDGSYHDVDSNEMAFKIAGSMAFKEAAKQGQPGAAGAGDGGRSDGSGEHLGTIIGDINSRRGGSRAWSMRAVRR